MIELALVVFILGFFLFPTLVSAGCLGLYTTWFLFRSYESLKNQPLEGKRVQSIARIAFFINVITSLILGFSLALMVYVFIFDYFYLFLFNFIFCFLISIRWFDFSYKFFKRSIMGNKNVNMNEKGFFVLCKAYKNLSSFRMSPVYTDAGILSLEDNQIIFKGSFTKQSFTSNSILKIEKKSYEKLKIYTHPKTGKEPNMFLISLKDKFYPFKSRDSRNTIYNFLASDFQN